MKKVKNALLIVILAVIMLPACKKGADDPYISLRSRNARLMQTWKLSKIEGTFDNNIITFDGSNIKSGSSVQFSSATFSMTFAKDGAFSYTESETNQHNNPFNYDNKSYWTWLSANKHRDFLSFDANLFGMVSSGTTYYVDCLKESSLVLKVDDESSTSTTSLKFTFTK